MGIRVNGQFCLRFLGAFWQPHRQLVLEWILNFEKHDLPCEPWPNVPIAACLHSTMMHRAAKWWTATEPCCVHMGVQTELGMTRDCLGGRSVRPNIFWGYPPAARTQALKWRS